MTRVCSSLTRRETHRSKNSLEPFLNLAQEDSWKRTVTLAEELCLWVAAGGDRNQTSDRETAYVMGAIQRASVRTPLRIPKDPCHRTSQLYNPPRSESKAARSQEYR